MKLVTFIHKNEERIGMLTRDEKHVALISDWIEGETGKYVPDMNGLIQTSGSVDFTRLMELAESGSLPTLCTSEIRIISPIPYPRRDIICLGKNYAEHAAEIKVSSISSAEIPAYPIYFSKMASPTNNPDSDVVAKTSVTREVDYEVELAVIIGKDGTDIRADEAFGHVFGYTIVNDISARDLQGRHSQWFRGKSLDGFAPMGPAILHSSAVEGHPDLSITLELNGATVQSSRTSNLIFDIPFIISDLSRSTTLRAGDVVITGTPAGTGMGFDPPKYLKDGDVMVCDIEGIGRLKNVFRQIP